MLREAAFSHATDLVSRLPCNRSAIDFWDTPRIGRNGDRAAWRRASTSLERLSSDVAEEISFYFAIWASDAAVGAGDLDRGLALMPLPALGGRSSLRASNRLDLKVTLNHPPTARDVTALFGPKVTAFGKANLEPIEQYIQIQLDERAARGQQLQISDWTADAHQHQAGYSLFNGHPSYIVTKPPTGWHFSYSKQAESDCVALIRDAENTWREECDLPRIGEGWVSETKLFYEIKAALPDMDVLQHYRPDWLGRQHLDIAIPTWRVAVEYQGTQHDQPIAFFGGPDAFARTLERDKRKLNKCRRNGWRLIYVRERYQLADVLGQIIP